MKIIQIMDRVRKIGSEKLYDGKKKPFLANAYDLESNNNVSLKNGWSLEVLGGANDSEFFGQQISVRAREIKLSFTCQNIGNSQNADMIFNNSQRLMKDCFDLVDDLIGDSILGSFVTSINYISDDGISIFGGEKGKEYMLFSLSFNVGYRESEATIC